MSKKGSREPSTLPTETWHVKFAVYKNFGSGGPAGDGHSFAICAPSPLFAAISPSVPVENVPVSLMIPHRLVQGLCMRDVLM
jgi:hypothetical protein